MKTRLIIILMFLFPINLLSQSPLKVSCETHHFLWLLSVKLEIKNNTNEDIFIPMSNWMLSYAPYYFPPNTCNFNCFFFVDKNITYKWDDEWSKSPSYEKFPKLLKIKPKANKRINILFITWEMFELYKNDRKIDPSLLIIIKWANKNDIDTLKEKLQLPIEQAVLSKDDEYNVFMYGHYIYDFKYLSSIEINDEYRDSFIIRECFRKNEYFRFPFNL